MAQEINISKEYYKPITDTVDLIYIWPKKLISEEEYYKTTLLDKLSHEIFMDYITFKLHQRMHDRLYWTNINCLASRSNRT